VKNLISVIKDLLASFLTYAPPELDESHADTRYAMQESKNAKVEDNSDFSKRDNGSSGIPL
jgi:hypothetical protein